MVMVSNIYSSTLSLGVFEKAIDYYKTSAPELKEERAMLLGEWFKIECSFGELGDMELVRAKLPKKLKKRRHIEINECPAERYANNSLINFFDAIFATAMLN